MAAQISQHVADTHLAAPLGGQVLDHLGMGGPPLKLHPEALELGLEALHFREQRLDVVREHTVTRPEPPCSNGP